VTSDIEQLKTFFRGIMFNFGIPRCSSMPEGSLHQEREYGACFGSHSVKADQKIHHDSFSKTFESKQIRRRSLSPDDKNEFIKNYKG